MTSGPYKSPEFSNTAPAGVTNTLATLSMGLGIASLLALLPSLCCCLFIFVELPAAISAVVTGLIALQQIRDGRATGKPLAICGIVCGGVALLAVVGLLILQVVFGILSQGDMGQGMPFDFDLE